MVETAKQPTHEAKTAQQKRLRNIVGSDLLLARLFRHHPDHALDVLKGVQPRVVVDLEPPPEPKLAAVEDSIDLSKPTSLKMLAKRVADKYGLSFQEMLADTRVITITEARQEYFYRALTETTKSTRQIGDVVGRDHSTVLYGAGHFAVRRGLSLPRGMVWRAKYGARPERNAA